MNSPSPTSSISSGTNSMLSVRNGPHSKEYIKSNKNIFLTYSEGASSFQQGPLGDNDTFLSGTVHLNFQKSSQVKSVYLLLKGMEKTSWYRSQARGKTCFSGEHTLLDQSNKIWEAFDESEEITSLEIPFKVQLPYNLPDSISTEVGSVQYVLRVNVNTKSLIGSQQTVKLIIPLKRVITLDNQSIPPYKLNGETPSGIDYTFILPPNKSFNIGSYISIPLKLRFLKPEIGIEKLDVNLRTSMDFQSSTQGESKHIDQPIIGLSVKRTDLFFSPPTTEQYFGECTYTINLFIPKKVHSTHQGRFISIAHFLSIKFCLWGFETEFQIEESIRIANIIEQYPQNLSVSRTPLTPQFTPPLPHRVLPSPPPQQQHVETAYQLLQQQQQQQKQQKLYYVQNNNSVENFYEQPFDGYNSLPPQQSTYSNFQLYRNNGQYYQPETSRSQRNSGISTPDTISTNSSEFIVNGQLVSPISSFNSGQDTFPTHLSPPPYRQAARQQQQ